jgi:hypothetical protein
MHFRCQRIRKPVNTMELLGSLFRQWSTQATNAVYSSPSGTATGSRHLAPSISKRVCCCYKAMRLHGATFRFFWGYRTCLGLKSSPLCDATPCPIVSSKLASFRRGGLPPARPCLSERGCLLQGDGTEQDETPDARAYWLCCSEAQGQ